MLAATDTTGDALRAGTETPSVLGKRPRSHLTEAVPPAITAADTAADSPNQVEVRVTDFKGTPISVSLPVGDHLHLRAAGYPDHNHVLIDTENEKEYCPFAREHYIVKPTNPKFIVYALATPVAEAIEALYRIRSMTPVGYDPSWEACDAVGSLLCTDLLRADCHVALAAVVQIDGTTLQYFADTVRDNPDVVLAAVKTNVSRYGSPPFTYASDALKSNREIVMEVLRLYDGHATNFLNTWLRVSWKLMSDRELVMAAVRMDGDALEQASEELQDDPDVVLAAVEVYGFALRHASERLRDCISVVRAAVAEDGLALRKASPRLRGNRELCLAAVATNGDAMAHCSDTLKNTLEFVIAAVKLDGDVLRFCSDEMKNTPAVIRAAIDACKKGAMCSGFQHSSPQMRNTKEFALAAVRKCGTHLGHVSLGMRGDRAVVMAAIRQIACTEYKRPGTGSNVFMYASNELRMSKPFATEVVKRFPDAFEHCGYSLRHDLDFAMAAVGQHGKCLQMCSQTLRNTKAVVLAALSQYSDDTDYVFWHCSTKLQTDKDVVLAAIRHQNGFAGKGRWHLNERCDLERVVTTLYRRDLEVVAAAFYSRFYPRGLFAHSCREILDNAPHETREAVRVSYEAARWIASRVDSIVAQMLRRYNIIAY